MADPLPDAETVALRETAVALFRAAVAAADPAKALAKHLKSTPLPCLSDDGRYILLAVGKAAVAMMREAQKHLPEGAKTTAIIVTNQENATEVPGCRVIAGGHPVPDEKSAEAGEVILETLAETRAGDHVIALISGGGSALLAAPAAGISLADKASVNKIMLAAGLDIIETNLVRQQISRLKGGKLAKAAAPAQVQAYILSDVIGDDLRAIASGPTVGPIGSRKNAAKLLKKYNVFKDIPASVQKHLSDTQPADASENPAVTNTLIGSNRKSLEAVLAASGELDARIVSDRLTGDVTYAAEEILRHIKSAPTDQKLALIFGGETTVKIKGNGKGGRNQELALRMALAGVDMPGHWVFLSGGTDGRDGPTDAAGGLVDRETVARMQDAGIDAKALLANNDSYAALGASGDLLITGGTGTNVADIQIFLYEPPVE